MGRKIRCITEGSAAAQALDLQETVDVTTSKDREDGLRRVLCLATNEEFLIDKKDPEDGSGFRSGPRN